MIHSKKSPTASQATDDTPTALGLPRGRRGLRRRSPRPGILGGLVALTVALVSMLATASPSSAATLGGTTTYSDGGIRCLPTERGMLIAPPKVAYSGSGLAGTGIASVAWQPVIYRYYPGSGWQPYTNSTLFQYQNANSQFFQVAVNSFGVTGQYWTNQYTGRVLNPDFKVWGFPAGSYAVRSYLWKSSDGQTVNWWASAGGYCTF